MRTYKELVDIIEGITGGSVGFRIPIGGTKDQLPGFKGVTGSVQGGSGGTRFGASGSLGSGTVSGQGDRINQGIDAALRNYETGGNDNTSTSTIRKGLMGTFNANVSGGKSRPTSAPAPKPVKPVKPTTPTKPTRPTSTTPTQPSPRPTVSPAVQQQLTKALPVGQQSGGPKAPKPDAPPTESELDAYRKDVMYSATYGGGYTPPASRAYSPSPLDKEAAALRDADTRIRDMRSRLPAP